jgi:hypothetical protein
MPIKLKNIEKVEIYTRNLFVPNLFVIFAQLFARDDY